MTEVQPESLLEIKSLSKAFWSEVVLREFSGQSDFIMKRPGFPPFDWREDQELRHLMGSLYAHLIAIYEATTLLAALLTGKAFVSSKKKVSPLEMTYLELVGYSEDRMNFD